MVASDPGVDVVWRAFELRPAPAPTLDPGGEYLKSAWSRSVLPLAARLGVAMTLPPVQPRTRLAHRAAHWARGRGRAEAMHEAIFRAFFERGEDIGSVEVLAVLASGAGLDGDALRAALERGDHEDSVLGEETRAEAYGLRGVPAFVADGRVGITGVQPVEGLRALLAHARGEESGQ